MDLAEIFVDLIDVVAGERRELDEEAIRKFRQIANLVDPPLGEEESDDRQRLLAGIREARNALDEIEGICEQRRRRSHLKIVRDDAE